MRVALALLALTGCTQVFGLTDPVRETTGDAPLADVVDVVVDTVGIDTAIVPARCDPGVSALIACYDFEGNTLDGSSTANHAVGTNVVYALGPRGNAIRVDLTSRIAAPTVSALNVASFTIESWVRLESLPADAGRAGVYDADARYGLFILGDGSFSTRSTPTPAGLVQTGQWYHLAVTDDGSVRLFYVNGSQVASYASTAVPTSNNSVEIGGNAPIGDDRLVGAIDLVRVYRSILTPAQILTDAEL